MCRGYLALEQDCPVHYHSNACIQLTLQGEVALFQGFVQGQDPGVDVHGEPGAVGRTSERVHPAQVEVRPLRVVVQHGVDLQDRRPRRLADIHRLNVLLLGEVQPCCSCRKT